VSVETDNTPETPETTQAEAEAEAEAEATEQPGGEVIEVEVQPEPEPEAPAGEPTLETLQAERDELYQRLQRVSAEFENFQKRVKRDRATWSADARRGLLESMLPVLDNLDYAVAAFDREVKDPESLRHGVELVREELLRQLGNNGVTPIEAAEGVAFDPDLHQAVAAEPAEVEQEQISFVARKGYKLGEIVLRPAQVGIRKPE
jgi:molecular chaperone GrpE